ncbi:MAG: hypothetical protein LUE20_03800 [Oscillospiraceae bacterium]|nr:hypothetical protein [Oscillospiraceae bacterium]
MDTFELLYKHYEDTNALRITAQERRNKEFVALCVLEAISFLVLIKPEQAFLTLLEGVNFVVGTTLELGNGVLQSLLWALIIYFQIRYISDSLYVEKQYKYQDHLEKQISEKIDENIFREGDNYVCHYPIVLNLIDLFYKTFCPIIFEAINITRLYCEWKTATSKLVLVLDTILCVSSFIIMWFYFFEVNSKIIAWFKKCKVIKWLAETIRKILKEV